jgi:adenosylhomocysteine nucleosidase
MSLIVITGLAVEARIAIGAHVGMLVGAGRGDRLAADLEAAIARGARRLLSFGVAGALAPQLQAGDLVIAEGLQDGPRRLACDPSWRAAMGARLQDMPPPAWRDERFAPDLGGDRDEMSTGVFRLRRDGDWRPIAPGGPGFSADIAGVDSPLADAAGKAAFFAATGAAAVDMESAIVARAAQRHGLPFAILRVIADPAHRPLPSTALVAMRADGEVDLAAVLGALIREPGQLPALIRLGLDSRRAFSALVHARALLGAEFASVNAPLDAEFADAPLRDEIDARAAPIDQRRRIAQAAGAC